MSDDAYTPVDPTLAVYDRGVAELHLDGELRAHLACRVHSLWHATRANEPWPWFVVVWPDGTKEWKEEDYSPGWYIVRELDAGQFRFHSEPTVVRPARLFGRVIGERLSNESPEVTYDVHWLPADEAASTWESLGLEDSDF